MMKKTPLNDHDGDCNDNELHTYGKNRLNFVMMMRRMVMVMMMSKQKMVMKKQGRQKW